MARVPVRYSATNQNLLDYALEPTMRWLITVALAGTKIQYGEIKRRLENEEGFSTIFATRIGYVAGSLMDKIHNVDRKAPLINVLVVSQKDEQPSDGAGSFMAARFNKPLLAWEGAKEKYPKQWEIFSDRAAGQVYKYSPEDWADLYRRVFGRILKIDDIENEREKRQVGNENDFGAGKHKYGAGGESEYHRSLRLWITANPAMVRRTFAEARTETEFYLDSADRVDVVYHLPDRTIVLEVKSKISNDIDLRRGVYQCVKYRAVKKAMDVRNNIQIEAILVTEEPISGEIEALLKQNKIRHYQAPSVRKL